MNDTKLAERLDSAKRSALALADQADNGRERRYWLWRAETLEAKAEAAVRVAA